MKYIRIEWKHDLPDEPTMLYSELNDDRWELRKVEVYRDGKVGYASTTERSEGSMLSEGPLPELEEIAQDSQFSPSEIAKDDFESMWATRTTRPLQPPSKESATSRTSRPRRSRPH